MWKLNVERSRLKVEMVKDGGGGGGRRRGGEATWGGRGASEAEHFAPVTRAAHQKTNTWGGGR